MCIAYGEVNPVHGYCTGYLGDAFEVSTTRIQVCMYAGMSVHCPVIDVDTSCFSSSSIGFQ